MPAIGPELPPHLLSQIPSSTSEDEFGPQVLSGSSSVSRSRPSPSQFPLSSPKPIVESTPERKLEENDSDEDDYMPALPPDLLTTRSITTSEGTKSSFKRVLGPSFPPQRPQEEDEEDDDVGPVPLPAWMNKAPEDGVREFLEREERRQKMIEDASKPKRLQRDEWMLVPPSSTGLLATLDPAKLRQARQFSKSSTVKSTDNTLWTETPAERQQRLKDEVSGKRKRIENAEPEAESDEAARKRIRDSQVRMGVDDYTRKHRGPALISQHEETESTSKVKESSEGPPVIWDHGRDMGLGGRLMDDGKRNQIIKDARGLGDRFGSGKTGGFL